MGKPTVVKAPTIIPSMPAVQTAPRPPFRTVQPQPMTEIPSRPAMAPMNGPRPLERPRYPTNFNPDDSDHLMEDISLPKPVAQAPKIRSQPRIN